jgi:hypothetical protein
MIQAVAEYNAIPRLYDSSLEFAATSDMDSLRCYADTVQKLGSGVAANNLP